MLCAEWYLHDRACMNPVLRRSLPLIAAFSLGVSGTVAQNGPPAANADTSSATAVVARMTGNEVAARKQEIRYSYLSDERSTRTGGHLWHEKVVETPDGPLHRLLAVDGHPLSSSEAQAESNRIAALVQNPDAFRRLNAAHADDESHAAQLLQLLPKAFLLVPNGEENGCTRFAFRPNPNFQPSSYEERAIHAMGGTVSLRQPEGRLCHLHATIEQPVEFGFGLLGTIEKGGYFDLERKPVDGNNWKSDHISVHVQGKILMLKSLTREQETQRSEIKVIPQHLSLEQAGQLSLP